jgi:hypothetical protein
MDDIFDGSRDTCICIRSRWSPSSTRAAAVREELVVAFVGSQCRGVGGDRGRVVAGLERGVAPGLAEGESVMKCWYSSERAK